jgi:hypothetical protein
VPPFPPPPLQNHCAASWNSMRWAHHVTASCDSDIHLNIQDP